MPPGMRIGYFLSSGEYTPAQLIEQARLAQDAGFQGLPGQGHEASDAVKALIDWCNEQGGINGRQVKGIYYDARITEINNVMAEACTQAVELADWAPPVLDSRAMGYFRLGRYEDALRDLNAALSASPELGESLLMRGVVRRAMGDRGGQDDIRAALARTPSLARLYARFGIKVN